MLQQCLKKLWNVWQHDYICDLTSKNQAVHNQTKRNKKEPSKISEVVSLHDENLPRARWKIGKIVEVPLS